MPWDSLAIDWTDQEAYSTDIAVEAIAMDIESRGIRQTWDCSRMMRCCLNAVYPWLQWWARRSRAWSIEEPRSDEMSREFGSGLGSSLDKTLADSIHIQHHMRGQSSVDQSESRHVGYVVENAR
jgi:hypothetical protein